MVDDSIQFINLGSETPVRRKALATAFYEEVYRDAFPKPDEAETPDVWLPLLGEAVPSGQPRIYIVLACLSTGQILGGAIFEEYRVSACWLLTYLVVRAEARRRGVAKALLSLVIRTVDTIQTHDRVLLAEAENPARLDDPIDRAQAEERLRVLDKLGMRQLPIDYVQPALGPGQSAVNDLLLLYFDTRDCPARISVGRIVAFLKEFYGALGQADAPYLAQIDDMLAKQDMLVTRRLVS
jgi:GNAT superfamily N-acetyltransferase